MKYVKSVLFFLCVTLLLVACKKECSHQYESQITKEATCTTEGEEILTCGLCRHSYTQKIQMLSHTYGSATVEKEATCSEEGAQKLSCTVCGTVESKPIAKLPHTLQDDYTITREPNCTQVGEKQGTCAICGAEQVSAEILTNNTHAFTDTVVRASTCTEKGEGVNTCSLCGHTEPCTYPKKGHTYGQKTVVKQATCTQKGELQGVCADCGYAGKEVVSALGHSWNNATCQQDKVCTACGVGDGKGDHAYTILKDRQGSNNFAGYREKKCDICGEQKKEYYVITEYRENTVIFDLEAIAEEIKQYGKEKGLNVRIESFDTPTNKYTIAVGMVQKEVYGPGTLVKVGKQYVDKYYEELKDTPLGIDKYVLIIHVYYTQSGAVGSGYFGIYAKRGTA